MTHTNRAPDQQPGNTTTTESDAARFAAEAARVLHEDKCEDVLLLDVRGMSQVCDYLVIATGSSGRQMGSALQHIEELGAECGLRPFGSSRQASSSWLIVDFVDVVVHLFEANARAYYDLEMLWSDAPRLDWRAIAKSGGSP